MEVGMIERYGIFTVDPGGVTGAAWGVFDLNGRTVSEIVADALAEGLIGAAEVGGEYWDQAEALTLRLFGWLVVEELVDAELVIEGFALRQRNVDLSPVEVTAGLVTIVKREDPALKIVYQDPGNAKQMVTSSRLRGLDLAPIGRGSDHKRDALRHLVLRVMRVKELRERR